jgi:hypothetical protein
MGNENSGRQGKEIEQKMIEQLSVFTEDAYRVLGENINKGKYWAIKLWFERMYGKAKEYKDVNVTSNQETPLFHINYTHTEETENNKLNKYDEQN